MAGPGIAVGGYADEGPPKVPPKCHHVTQSHCVVTTVPPVLYNRLVELYYIIMARWLTDGSLVEILYNPWMEFHYIIKIGGSVVAHLGGSGAKYRPKLSSRRVFCLFRGHFWLLHHVITTKK